VSHMVIYRGADGKPGYQQAEDIHDAVTFVEQMRNGEGVEHARIFRLEEVVFDYRPYYRVELSGAMPEVSAPPTAPVPLMVATAPEMADEVPAPHLDEPFEVVESTMINVDDPDGDVVSANGARRGLFGR